MEEKQDQLLSVPTQLLLSLEHIRTLMSHYPAASSLFLYASYWGWGGELQEWEPKEGAACGIPCLSSCTVSSQVPYQQWLGREGLMTWKLPLLCVSTPAL